MQQPILLATDGSASARGATEFAIRIAAATEWPLHVVTVGREAVDGELVLDAVRAEAEASGVHPVLHLRAGDAADEICAAALVHDAQLIVIGAHGWSQRSGPPGGSVSAAVRHRAHAPVVVVAAEVPARTLAPA